MSSSVRDTRNIQMQLTDQTVQFWSCASEQVSGTKLLECVSSLLDIIVQSNTMASI